jgi:hypothetical protein
LCAKYGEVVPVSTVPQVLSPCLHAIGETGELVAGLLSTPPARPARLRELLAAAPGGTPLIAPGAYDALSARLVEQAGSTRRADSAS